MTDRPEPEDKTSGGATLRRRYGAEYFKDLGRRGGIRTGQDREHMAEIGKKGGEATLEERGVDHLKTVGSRGGQVTRDRFGPGYYQTYDMSVGDSCVWRESGWSTISYAQERKGDQPLGHTPTGPRAQEVSWLVAGYPPAGSRQVNHPALEASYQRAVPTAPTTAETRRSSRCR